jgi:signal transduction histidine kinase
MLHSDQENILLIVAGTILLLGIFIISFLFLYQRKRNMHIVEHDQLRSAFSQEILTTQIEVQEQTLNYISQELHDNIGQVLSFVKLNLGTTATMDDEQKKQRKINESRDLLAQVITDLRDLSKSLSFQQISQYGLTKAMMIEIGAAATLQSSPGKGCIIKVNLNPIKQLNINGSHSDSISG